MFKSKNIYLFGSLVCIVILLALFGAFDPPAGPPKREVKKENKAADKVIKKETKKREDMQPDSIEYVNRIKELEREIELLYAKIENIDTHPKYEKDYPKPHAPDAEYDEFSQNVTVKKMWLDNIVDELRTKDILTEKVRLQKELIDTLTVQAGVYREQVSHTNQYNQSCLEEKAAWETKATNFENLYKGAQRKKNKKGLWNWVLGAALVGVTYGYITK